jgi:hypothetical protein
MRRKRKIKERKGCHRAALFPFPYWWALTVL